MQHTRHKLYEPVLLKDAVLQPYSPLYSIEPIGAGSGLVESLTSYLSRLAIAHCWPTGVLISFLVVPVVNKPYMFEGGARKENGGSTLSRIRGLLKTINGLDSVAADFVRATELLTCQHGLERLTLLGLGDLLPARNLLRNVKAWCSACYGQWRDQGDVIYDPLIWSIAAIDICVVHKRSLTTRCPYCNEHLAFLCYMSRPGYCTECKQWLGSNYRVEEQKGEEIPANELNWPYWKASNVSQMLTASQTPGKLLSSSNILKSLATCISRTQTGTMTELALLLGKRKSTVWGWQHGKNKPTLIDLLQICSLADCSLLDFIMANERVISTNLSLNRTKGLHPIQSFAIRRTGSFNRATIEQELRWILEEQPPISMRQAAKRVGYSVRTLYRRFPELCKQISARFRSYRTDLMYKDADVYLEGSFTALD